MAIAILGIATGIISLVDLFGTAIGSAVGIVLTVTVTDAGDRMWCKPFDSVRGISTGCALTTDVGVNVVDVIGVVEINIEFDDETVIEVDVFGRPNAVDAIGGIGAICAIDVMGLLSGGGRGKGWVIDEGMLIIVGADG